MSRRKITATANFARNLEGLRVFHTEHPGGFERAVARLQDELLPLLRQQANVGRPYERGEPGRPIIENIRARRGGGVLRELVVDDYVVLYLVTAKQVALMSIRHGRELDFDFGD